MCNEPLLKTMRPHSPPISQILIAYFFLKDIHKLEFILLCGVNKLAVMALSILILFAFSEKKKYKC